MSDTVIQVENLGKKYIIGHQQEGESRYMALRDVLAEGTKALGQRLRQPFTPVKNPQREEFWALKDISFDVKQGECVGIIGRNGAGKSTLLKILSRITEPTEGRVKIRGRVASLLEVGTGFHPELTGRENIYLNGAILGMMRVEISKKFDEIVAFAEVEKFLDTPVKRYSSGMYVRLAFAVAAHLEPEILVVDEVLAVGDAAFQKKCLGKMGHVATKEGRTVLFVSHNMTAITTLCNKAVLIEEGNLEYFSDNISKLVHRYIHKNDFYKSNLSKIWANSEAPGNENIKLKGIKVLLEDNSIAEKIDITTSIKIECTYCVFLDNILFYFACNLSTLSGEIAFMSMSQPEIINKGLYKSTCSIPGNLLNSHQYSVHVYWTKDSSVVLYQVRDVIRFNVQDVEREEGAWMGEYLGALRPKLEWKTELLNEID